MGDRVMGEREIAREAHGWFAVGPRLVRRWFTFSNFTAFDYVRLVLRWPTAGSPLVRRWFTPPPFSRHVGPFARAKQARHRRPTPPPSARKVALRWQGPAINRVFGGVVAEIVRGEGSGPRASKRRHGIGPRGVREGVEAHA